MKGHRAGEAQHLLHRQQRHVRTWSLHNLTIPFLDLSAEVTARVTKKVQALAKLSRSI